MDGSTAIKGASEVDSEEAGALQEHYTRVCQLCMPVTSDDGEGKSEDDEEQMKEKERGREVMKASTEEPIVMAQSLIEVKIYNDSSEGLNDVTYKWFSNLTSGFSIREANKDRPSISNAVPTEKYMLRFDEGSAQKGAADEIPKNLEILALAWCDFVTSTDYHHLWIEIIRPSTSSEALSSPKHKLQVVSLSLGSFPSHGKYCRHWSSGLLRSHLKIAACFEYDLKIATISYEDEWRGKWKLETAFHHLDKFILVTPTQTGYHVTLFQKNPFKICFAAKSRPFMPASPSDVIDSEEPTETEFLWNRQIQFGDCPTEVVGSSNVIQLQLAKNESRLNDVLFRFAKLDFIIVTGNPILEVTSGYEPIAWPDFHDFHLTYAWYCLVSRGFRVTDQVTEEFLAYLSSIQREPWLEETIRAVTNAFDSASICNLEKQFQKESERIMNRKFPVETDELLIPHIVAIRRLILTPTTINGLGKEWTVENRVLREFGIDRFVRVSIRDDDFTRLTSYVPIKEITDRIIDFLTNGFQIGDRHYRFLGCSNSQLRSHAVWMYASDGRETVDSIRTWMGDISHERCVATYVSRLGQCFTSTRNTVAIKNVEWIEDISGNTSHCFTDGIGRISKPLAYRVTKALNLRYTPSAFQIRFGGCKGVVALAPNLGDEDKLQLRKSMEKFPSEHNQLEVVEMTRPVRLYLNRQAMLLLSGLGVPDESFFKLQDRMLVNMANILIDENIAVKVISEAHLGIEWRKLKESGIVVTTEPFLREILSTIYRQRFNHLLKRTRIEIPEDKGRIMIGTIDEYDCLEYGEVFVQFSKDIDKPMHDKVVLNGNVVVTKNPCFHPGDMRKFMAVDKIELHHMVDCIVFPAKGQRPHPNEMSGSDLDGDMYFVCWEESLIPPKENQQAMDFTSQEKQILSKNPVEEADMIRFISYYIRSDQLGVIANAHLVHADSKGIGCDECLQIAQIHSDAVDFPKTGQLQILPQHLRPASYPDYMMKTDKPSYISNTVIGKLFHQCSTIALSNEFRKLEPILPDPDLILPGHETYLEGAKAMKAIYDKKMDDLKAMYQIATDVELLSVGTLGMQERLGHLKGDHYAITETIRLRLEAIKAKMKDMFYEEFGGANRRHDSVLLCRKASALYRISYVIFEQIMEKQDNQNQLTKNLIDVNHSQDEPTNSETDIPEQRLMEPDRQSLGLPWIFWDLLCMIKKQKSTIPMNDGIKPTEFKPKSFLEKISYEIASIKIANTAGDWKESHVRLLTKLNEFTAGSENGMKLIPFGSSITNCANNVSSLDVFVDNDSLHQPSKPFEAKLECFKKIAAILAEQIKGELAKGFGSKPKDKVRIFNIPDTAVEITLFSDSNCLRRTAYLVAAMVLNKWIVPVLRVVLAWGRNNGISRNSGDSLLSEEELAVMFFYVTLDVMKYGYLVSEDILNRSQRLLLENHFQVCRLDECIHIEMNQSVAGGSTLSKKLDMSHAATDKAEKHLSEVSLKLEEEICCGRAVFDFLQFYGVSRGSAMKNIPDPGRANDKRCLLNLKDRQYIQLGEQMLQAYHALANCATIDEFVNPECQENRHFTMVLPNEVSSLFRYVEAGWAGTLRKETGASDVNIRKKTFRGFQPGHIIEAWGNAGAIRSLHARIQNIIGSSACFTEGKVPGANWAISGAHKMVFEGVWGPESMLRICPYKGRCQNWHQNRLKQTPKVIKSDFSDAYNVGQVVSHFEDQRLFLSKNYEPHIHGGIRIAVSFGNFYTFGFKLGKMEVEKLNIKLCQRLLGEKSKHVSNSQAATNHTSRKEMGTFIPANDLDLERFTDFLQQHNFAEVERRREYRATVKMDVSSGVIVLNENFDLTLVHLQDIKWFVLDVLRGRTSLDRQPRDIRIKIHSRPVITADELAKREGCRDLKENATHLLHRNSSGEVDGIALDEYKDRVRYLRYKDMRNFRFRGKTESQGDDSEDNFLNRFTLKLNRGKEYRIPTDGFFTKVTDQTELILETELPNLKEKEECEEFMREIYEFSKEFARRVFD